MEKLNAKTDFNLLSFTEAGGCSAKIPPHLLSQVLQGFDSKISDPRLLVGLDTSDDAAVFKISEDVAIIQTTDFFPPLCGDPYEFGQIAAANALSDVFAMGGEALLALNLVMFPTKKMDLGILREILRGGSDKVQEAGAVIAGGHSIDDVTPKYGLCVTGSVHPDKIVTNAGARVGDHIIITKPLGSGVVMAGHKIGEIGAAQYQAALDGMKQLNKGAAAVMRAHGITGGTDITGFGLLGHLLEMARASGVCVTLDSKELPLLDGVYDLLDMGCIPAAAFQNLRHVESTVEFSSELDYNLKMLTCDAQTSGGMLLSCPAAKVQTVIKELKEGGFVHSRVVGQVERATVQADDCSIRCI
jgi:selenide,water dikinase